MRGSGTVGMDEHTHHCIEHHVYTMCADIILELSKELDDFLWASRPWQSPELHTVSLPPPQTISI